MLTGQHSLWYAETDAETVEEAETHRFFRTDCRRTMIYSREDVGKRCRRFQRMQEGQAMEFSKGEQQWLLDCIRARCESELADHQGSSETNDKAFMNSFERELEIERAKMQGKEENEDG